MLAAVWYGPGRENTKLERIERPVPQNGELLIRVRAAIYGALSQRAMTVGHPKLKPPRILGRMFAGDVVEAAGDVPLREGMRVTLNPESPCGTCFYCQRGEFIHCENLPVLNPGAFAEYILINSRLARGIHAVPDSIPYEHAAFSETVACALYGVDQAAVALGDTTVVIGCGNVGLVLIQLLRLRGASRVIAVDIADTALAAALRVGATEAVNPSSQPLLEAVRNLTEGRGADVAIEAVGSAQTYAGAFELVRAGGRIIGFGGTPPGQKMSLEPNLVHYKTLRLIGVYHYLPPDYRRALTLVTSGQVKLSEVITHHLPLERIHDGVDIYPSQDCRGLAIHP
jgi:L-iditol 2-dehydrogenase